jgi:transposase-like protein
MPNCQACSSSRTVKNGHIHTGKQRFKCAVAHTDLWAVLTSKRHQAGGKETSKTSYIERFNNALWQRVSRLVQKTLSFPKSARESHRGGLVFYPLR